MQLMVTSGIRIGWLMKYPSSEPIDSEITVAPKMVRFTNVLPTILNAMASNVRLVAYWVTATGIRPLVAK